MAYSYKILRKPECPISGTTGAISEHRFLLYQKIGPGPHPCFHCGSELNWIPGGRTRSGAVIVDHLDGNGLNNNLENLVPSCHKCNTNRGLGEHLVREEETFITQANGRRARAVKLTCDECGDPYFRSLAVARSGKSRFCSNSCRSKRVNLERSAAGLYKKK